MNVNDERTRSPWTGLAIDDTTSMRLSRRSALKFAAASVGFIAAGALLAACGDDDEDEDAAESGGAAAGTHTVDMTADNVYDPDELTIRVGDTVTWRVVGAMPHSATADPAKAADPEEHVALPDGADPWDSGILTEGQEFSHTFSVAGDYTYFCIPHESLGMVGKITVEEA